MLNRDFKSHIVPRAAGPLASPLWKDLAEHLRNSVPTEKLQIRRENHNLK